jgi:hypothetical protein
MSSMPIVVSVLLMLVSFLLAFVIHELWLIETIAGAAFVGGLVLVVAARRRAVIDA